MAKLCDPDINMLTIGTCRTPEPSIRHMVYMYYDSAGMGSQQSKAFTEDLLEQQDQICQASLTARDNATWNAAIEAAAGMASNACLVPPDGGSPTDEEVAVCVEATRRIRRLKKGQSND